MIQIMRTSDKSVKLIEIFILIVLIVAGILPFNLRAENKQEKERARVSLDYFAYDNERYVLEAEIKTKVDRVYQTVPGVLISFYVDSISQANLVGRDTSNAKGVARIKLPKSLISTLNQKVNRTYYAVLRDHPRFRNEEESMDIQSAWLDVTFNEGDSLNTVITRVNTLDTSLARTPISDVPIRIFVNRSFGMLGLNEMFETTNEKGRYEFIFPDDIPGDENGELEVVVKVNDHFLFGNLINKSTVNWGIPIRGNDLLSQRELWSARANAPIWLILVSNAIILGVWGVIVYIVFQLFKIRKLGAIE